ncbi:unnamed protein product [Nezara viridula]|uniref:Uncharacterized protein n=1 Tax=Nezara viridula TaxID=85310 RepID=A0A9P0HBM6_NEZVI|nr:unnamed protein product [Nezara viridula]
MATDTICRLCSLDCDNYVKLFEQESEKADLVEKIKQCLQIWICPEDTLPKAICLVCYGKLEEFFNFYSSCHQSQSCLMEIFKKKDIHNNSSPFNIFPLSEKGTEIYQLTDFDEKTDLDYDVDCVLLDDRGSANTLKKKRAVKTPRKTSFEDVLTENFRNEKIEINKPSKSREIKSESQDEERSDLDDDLFDFPNSSQSFSSKKIFEDYVWKCSDCDKELSSLSSLKLHYQQVHNQAPNFKCTYCNKVYTRYRSFARHVKLHVDSKKYSCDICGKCFSQKTVLQSHSTVHSEERPHVCPQCGKAFKQFSSLYLHSKCHLPEQAKPKYPCSVCLKVFSSKHTVETHMKLHTGERNFICDICGKRFISKGSLDYHILAHNDAKPHSCQVCGKCFKTARLLAKHSTVHTGVKPHQCDVCGKQFRERGALKEHNRIHTGAMPYSCEYCGKNFRFKGILTVHRRQHTGERPYSCGECRREFTNWANYNKHMKRRHKSRPSPVMNASEMIPVGQDTSLVSPPPPPPPPPYIECAPPQPPPPPYKLPEDGTFRVQPPPSYPSPPIHMAYYLHPLHGILQRTD